MFRGYYRKLNFLRHFYSQKKDSHQICFPIVLDKSICLALCSGTKYHKFQVNSITWTISTCSCCSGRHLLVIHFVDHSLYSQRGLPQESVDGGTTLGKFILDLKIKDIRGDGLKRKSLQDINSQRCKYWLTVYIFTFLTLWSLQALIYTLYIYKNKINLIFNNFICIL